MGIIICHNCGRYSSSQNELCPSCGAYLFGEVIDDSEISQDKNKTTDSNHGCEIIVKSHNFEKAKNHIKKFSEQPTTKIELDKVDDMKDLGEWFGDLFCGRGMGVDHVVKGEELNKLVASIQSHLIIINETEIKIIKEFCDVYNAFEALDMDYIQNIASATMAAKLSSEKANTASQQAKIAIEATNRNVENLAKTQQDLKSTMANLKSTVQTIYNLKSSMDKIQHLNDIDTMWDRNAETEKQLSNAELTISNQQNEIDNLKAELSVIQHENDTKMPVNQKLAFAFALGGVSFCTALTALILLFLR